MYAGQKRADATPEAAAGAEKETVTETAIVRETKRDDDIPAPGPGLGPETVSGTETEIETTAKGETSLPAGTSAHPAPEKTKSETLTAGRTNTWTVLHQKSHLLGTSTTGKSPVSCSLDALFSWRDYGQ